MDGAIWRWKVPSTLGHARSMYIFCSVNYSALKEQAIAWVKDMLVFYDGRLETSDCCDGYVVAAAIDLACSLGA